MEDDMGGDNEAVIEQFRAAMEGGDISRMGALLKEHTADDFVQEWPQSGERIVGREASQRLNEAYAEETATRPQMTFKRMLGGGDVYVVESTIDYGDGVPVSYVGIAELRDGKVVKMTEYFANPFEAPAWRVPYVERKARAGI
jgi:ketosteroid isomerase-like protein